MIDVCRNGGRTRLWPGLVLGALGIVLALGLALVPQLFLAGHGSRAEVGRSGPHPASAASRSAHPATVRPATMRPATVRPATMRPATVRPATVRPASAPVGRRVVAGSGGGDALFAAGQAGVSLWSYGWDLPDGFVEERRRRWLTPQLAERLDRSPGAPALDEERRATEQTDSVTSLSVVVADRSADGFGIAVSAEVAGTVDGRPAGAGRLDAEMLVVSTPAGWRVSEIHL